MMFNVLHDFLPSASKEVWGYCRGPLRPSVANVSLSTEHSYGPRVLIPHQNVRLVIALIDFLLWLALTFFQGHQDTLKFVEGGLIFTIIALTQSILSLLCSFMIFMLVLSSWAITLSKSHDLDLLSRSQRTRLYSKRLRYRSKSKNINTRCSLVHIHIGLKLVRNLIEGPLTWPFFKVTRPLWSWLGGGDFHGYCSNSINFVSTVLIYDIHVGLK